jgi:hypothetical protein
MPEDGRRDLEQLAAPVDAVRGTERRRACPDQYAPRGRPVVVDVFDHERLLDLDE